MIQVYLYTNEFQTEVSQRIRSTILGIRDRFDLNLNEINVPPGHWLNDNLPTQFPQLKIGSFTVTDALSSTAIEDTLGRAQEYLRFSTDRGEQSAVDSLIKPILLTASDRVSLWFSRSYVWFFGLLVLIYVGLPLLAPVLMKTGYPDSANVIYRVYRVSCHQLGFRSFYLFGDQVAYPRELAGIGGLNTFEEVSGLPEDDLHAASAFLGNETLGYKVALCQRDMAIYGSILLFVIIFILRKRRTKAVPWFLWLVLALVPIGLDGVSQLVSQMELPMLGWLAMRESTPFLRVLTGFFFGWFTAWYAFPTIEESLNTHRIQLELKALASRQLRSN